MTFAVPGLDSIAALSNPLSNPVGQDGRGGLGRSVLFIDAGVTDRELLAASSGAVTYLLDSGRDAVGQITEVLAGWRDLESVQIVSHGRSGGIELGGNWVDLQTLPSYVDSLKSWGRALSEDGDILLYGCNVAQGSEGKGFVDLLAELTGADVGASEDLTGNSALGGDWNLEYGTGNISKALTLTQFAPNAYQQTLQLSVDAVVSVGESPYCVVTGDLNGDGKIDIVTANSVSNNISVRFGSVTGEFSGSENFGVGKIPWAVSIGDFNADGKADIATANSGDNTVSVLLGNGAGGFAGAFSISVGIKPRSLAAGDFNGDGKSDIAVANNGSNDVSILLSDSAGNLTTSTANIAVGTQPRSIIACDVNNDGNLDIITADTGSNATSILIGNGLGQFNRAPSVSVGGNPYSVAAGDFNSDGKIDIATANLDSSTVSVRLGDGSGGFSGSTTLVSNWDPYSLAVGDFNGDGKADLVTANVYNSVLVFLGDGTGGFIQPSETKSGLNRSIAIADFNGDGKDDFAFANTQANAVLVMSYAPPKITVESGTGAAEAGTQGAFNLTLDAPAPPGGLKVNFDTLGSTAMKSLDYSFTPGNNIISINSTSFTIAAGATRASLNVLPVRDYIVEKTETVTLKLLPSDDYLIGESTTVQFMFTNKVSTDSQGSHPVLGVADFNNDGKVDIATVNGFTTNTISIRLGNGMGNFTGDTDIVVGPSPQSFATDDFNGDGNLDVIVLHVNPFSYNKLSLLLGEGLGAFAVSNIFDDVEKLEPFDVTTGDFNGDGKADFATANIRSNSVSFFLGDGQGKFDISTFAVGTSPFAIAASDFNGDGKSDIVTANTGSGDVSILISDGADGFALSSINVGYAPRSVTVGDFNGDGRADIAAANSASDGFSSSVAILMGDGIGKFIFSTYVKVGSSPGSIAVGDFNGDGNDDFLTGNDKDISIRLGDGKGLFSNAPSILLGRATSAWGVEVEDFNGDGKDDITTLGISGSSNVLIFLNTPANTIGITDDSGQLPQPDLLLRNTTSGEVAIWGLNGSEITTSSYTQLADGTRITPDRTWQLISAKSDFNGDRINDLVWFNSLTTETAIWYMQLGSTGLNNIIGSSTYIYTPQAPATIKPGGAWQLTHVTDLLGDSRPEFLWEDRTNGYSAIWELTINPNGRAEVNPTTSNFITLNDPAKTKIQTGNGWKIAGIGNFDSDRTTRDLLWFNETTTETALWHLNSTTLTNSGFINANGNNIKPGLGWKPVAIANLDSLGPDEILWQNGDTIAVWQLNSNFTLTNKSITLDQKLTEGEQIQGIIDIDLDGSLELVVRQKNTTADTTRLYMVTPGTFQISVPTPPRYITRSGQTLPLVTGDSDWDIIDLADFGGPTT